MTDRRAKHVALRHVKNTCYKGYENTERRFVIVHLEDGGKMTITPLYRPYVTLRQARRKLQDYPGARLYQIVPVPVK